MDELDLRTLVDELGVEALEGLSPPHRSAAAARCSADFLRVASEAKLRGLIDALAFCGLLDEMASLCASGITVFAPTDAAFAQLARRTRCSKRLVRQILLAHLGAGVSMLSDLHAKRCAVALGGQTHAAYVDGGHTYVGTARLSRADIPFDGGVIHEVESVMVALQVTRDSHSEQVWKKTLQPSPCLLVVGAATNSSEYELHGCLLYAATGQLLPDALRGNVRTLQANIAESQSINFSEIAVMTKPPSLAKRRGAPLEGANRYRLLFSLWNTSTLSYVSWQHMATPLVVRNSFHMLPLEEKTYRRAEYARSRTRKSGTSATAAPPLVPGTPASSSPTAGSAAGTQSGGSSPVLSGVDPAEQAAYPVIASPHDLAGWREEPPLPSLPEFTPLPKPELGAGGHVLPHRPLPHTWMPLSQAAGLDRAALDVVAGAPRWPAPGAKTSTTRAGASGPRRYASVDTESVISTESGLESSALSAVALACSDTTGHSRADSPAPGVLHAFPPEQQLALLENLAMANAAGADGASPHRPQHPAAATVAERASAGSAAGIMTTSSAASAAATVSGASPLASPAAGAPPPTPELASASAGLSGLWRIQAQARADANETAAGAPIGSLGAKHVAGASPPPVIDSTMNEAVALPRVLPAADSPSGSCAEASPGSGSFSSDACALERCEVTHLSCSRGPAEGGTEVWLQGEGLTPELLVFFGDVPAKSVSFVCPQLLKCISPPACAANRRHSVDVRLVSPTSGESSRRALRFLYLPATSIEHAATSPAAPELLDRLLCSLERAQAAVAASAGEAGGALPAVSAFLPPTPPSEGSKSSTAIAVAPAAADAPTPTAAAGPTTAVARVFHTVDEHGYSLAEYVSTLRRCFGTGGLYRETAPAGASELQAQHQQLALMRTAERLSVSLANRPAPQALLERHILHQDGEAQQLAAKRKRLEGFLAERPPPERVLDPEAVEEMLQSPRTGVASADLPHATGGQAVPHAASVANGAAPLP